MTAVVVTVVTAVARWGKSAHFGFVALTRDPNNTSLFSSLSYFTTQI